MEQREISFWKSPQAKNVTVPLPVFTFPQLLFTSPLLFLILSHVFPTIHQLHISHLSPIVPHLSAEMLYLSLHFVHIYPAIRLLSFFHLPGLSGSPHLFRWLLTIPQSFIVCPSTVSYLSLAAHFAPAATNLCLLLIGFSSCFRVPSFSFSYS
jgi:hypothetical protein